MRILLLSLLILTAWAGDAEPGKLPSDVQSTIDKADKGISAAQAKADAEILKLRQALIKDLTKLQETYTKKGNLEAALAIKVRIDEENKQLPDLLNEPIIRVDPTKLRNYDSKRWETFPGTLMTINASSSVVAATLEPSMSIYVIPHPTDTWATSDGFKQHDFKGSSTMQRELPHMALTYTCDNTTAVVDPTKSITGTGPVVLRANDDNPGNNVGTMRVKIIVQRN